MNKKSTYILKVIAFAGVAAFTTLQARAERILFNLPVTAHWGRITLQPGEHTFDIPLASSWPQQIVLADNNRAEHIFPITELGGVDASRTYLLLRNVDGAYYVREFVSGLSSKVFTFQLPKQRSKTMAKGDSEKAIPAEAAGN